MIHWRCSSLAGLILTGRYQPVCARVAFLPDSRPKRAFCRAMERAFHEPRHVERIGATWALCEALRRS